MGTKRQSIGVPKKRQPEGLDGLVVRMGKIMSTQGEKSFSINLKHKGPYMFDKNYSRSFKMPKQGEKVYIGFIGNGKTIYHPDKVVGEKGQVYYQK